MGEPNNIKDVLEEVSNPLLDDGYFNFDLIRHNALKKIMRKKSNRFRNSHIYYIDLLTMKDIVRTVLYEYIASKDPIELREKSSHDSNKNGFNTFTDVINSTIPFLVYDRNGRCVRMIIQNNQRVRICDPSLSVCDIDFSSYRSFKLILYIRKPEERKEDGKRERHFDAFATGAAGDSLGKYKRLSLNKYCGRQGYYSVELKYAEFVRLYMGDVFRHAAWLMELPEVNSKGYLIRTIWERGDTGRKPKNESDLGLYDRTIRDIDNIFNYSTYAEIVIPIKNSEGSSDPVLKTVCRIQLT